MERGGVRSFGEARLTHVVIESIMTRMRQRHRIFYTLFSLHFLIYAVSPLSLTYENKQTFTQPYIAIKDLRLLVFDLLLAPFAQSDNQDEDSSSGQILLKKKRFTLSSDKLKPLRSYTKKVGVVSNFAVPHENSYIEILAQNNEYQFEKGFIHSFSGLSPPVV